MRALVKWKVGKNSIEVRDVPVPKIDPDEVLIKTIVCGVCSGDAKVIWQGMDETDPVVRHYVRAPVILGAENFGEIVEVGKQVKNWQVGDRVCAEVLQGNCEQCMWCRGGFKPACPECKGLGRGFDGAFAEYYKSKYMYLHKVPEVVSDDDAILLEMLAGVATNLCGRSKVRQGDFVVVIGPGTIGQLSAQVARANGANIVVVIGTTHSEHRLEKAKELGADVVINIDKEKAVEIIMEMTKGIGADLVVEASPSIDGVNTALQIVRKWGTIAQIGGEKGDPIPPVLWTQIYKKCLQVNGSNFHDWRSWERAIAMMASGRVKGAALLSHKFPLEQWKTAFQLVFDNTVNTKAALCLSREET